MARTKIDNLPKDMKIGKNDMRKITGGAYIEDLKDQSDTTRKAGGLMSGAASKAV